MTKFEKITVALLAGIAVLLALHLFWPRYSIDNGYVVNTLTGRVYTIYECRPQQSIFSEIEATQAPGTGKASAASRPAAER
jgi:hypothetical protein